MINIRDQELLTRFGKHVKKIRKAKNLAIEDVAIEGDIQISQVYRIESGKGNPTICTLQCLAKGLKITLQKLMDF